MYTSFRKWATQYAKRHNLEFVVFDHFYRLKNVKGQYVDYWKNGSYRRIDGSYFRVGSTRRGFGLDESFDYKQAPLEEIKSLALTVKEEA